MKNKIVVISFSACANPARPVYTSYEDFHKFDTSTCFDQDQAVQYLRTEGFEILPVLCARARGKMTLDTFFRFSNEILEKIPTDGSVTGCLLYMASGMVVDEIGNGDMHLIPQIRERVGYDVPIAIPMDFHGNMPYSILKTCNIITTFHTNPHKDVSQTQLRAAQLLARAIRAEQAPNMIGVTIPFTTADSCTCERGAGASINKILDELDTLPGVWASSFISNMYWSDNLCTQSLLAVSCDINEAAGLEATLLAAAEKIWALRDQFESIDPMASPADALSQAQTTPDGPFFVMDSGDNPTCSGTGDSAFMLELVEKMKIPHAMIAGIWDPTFVDACIDVGEGNTLTHSIGANIDVTSVKTTVSGTVKKLRFHREGVADGVSFVTDGGTVILVNRYSDMNPYDAPLGIPFIQSFGENHTDYHTIVLKLGYLLDDFVQVMTGCCMAMSPGIVELNVDALRRRLKNVPTPLYPLDENIEFEPKLV